MTITYEYGKNLYVNTTNKCDMHCEFCLRNDGDGVGSADSLWLEREPSREEILADIEKRDISKYSEIVFCGYGEPTYRLHDIFWVCDELKKKYDVKTRMDTNGHGDLINNEETAPQFKGRIDTVSISLNAKDKETYNARCVPDYDEGYESMKIFTREIQKYVPRVIMSVVDCIPKDEIEECREICEEIGAEYRVRVFGS